MNQISQYIYREANKFSGGLISERGARIGDSLVIAPIHGGEKRLILNRTEYTISSKSDFSVDVFANKILIPTVGPSSFSFLLTLEEGERFLLKAQGDIPFKLNGSYGYCSFLERGDRVMIGYTEFLFSPPMARSQPKGSVDIDRRVAQSDLSILLQGETGTGKTTLARTIHQLSGRGGRFVHLNLASFSEGIIESEIFGHVKGAFTGAVKSKGGALLESHKGTLFLDEVDSLPITLQTKLLLFLDSMEFRPVGGSSYRAVDTRLIFASGQRLEELVSDGRMRKDFYFRLASGLDIHLSPLREEENKIEDIMEDFAQKNGISYDRPLITFYKKMSWPGNVRQLLSHLKRKLVMSKRTHFTVDHMDHELEQKDFNRSSKMMSLEEMKRNYVKTIFKKLGNQRSKTLEILQISPPTLRTMLSGTT